MGIFFPDPWRRINGVLNLVGPFYDQVSGLAQLFGNCSGIDCHVVLLLYYYLRFLWMLIVYLCLLK